MPPEQGFVPSLHYRPLTPLYDVFIRLGLKEKAFRGKLIKHAGIVPDHLVLDVGCGTATLTLMVKKAQPEAVVTGFDYDLDALAFARRKITRARLDIALVRGTALELPFADMSFERVLSSLMFHHLTTENKQRAFREIFRILKPGGEFYLADFGPPNSRLMRFLTFVVGRFEKLSDNTGGRLPVMMAEAGFTDVAHLDDYNTVFGTVAFYKGKRRAR
ncbi:MAG: class I SAM-dependent methyltransferase [Dehalococcoidia bacterium]|nr:class I SAM-dependent methyltransferase [Dehalococcoidia bacterium]